MPADIANDQKGVNQESEPGWNELLLKNGGSSERNRHQRMLACKPKEEKSGRCKCRADTYRLFSRNGRATETVGDGTRPRKRHSNEKLGPHVDLSIPELLVS